MNDIRNEEEVETTSKEESEEGGSDFESNEDVRGNMTLAERREQGRSRDEYQIEVRSSDEAEMEEKSEENSEEHGEQEDMEEEEEVYTIADDYNLSKDLLGAWSNPAPGVEVSNAGGPRSNSFLPEGNDESRSGTGGGLSKEAVPLPSIQPLDDNDLMDLEIDMDLVIGAGRWSSSYRGPNFR